MSDDERQFVLTNLTSTSLAIDSFETASQNICYGSAMIYSVSELDEKIICHLCGKS